MDLGRDDVLFRVGIEIRLKDLSVQSLVDLALEFRGRLKQSKYKIWMRAWLLAQFSVFFSYLLFRDINRGYFSWGSAAVVVLLSIPFGFLMSKLVPMRFDRSIKKVTMSVDVVYLILIWLLVIIRITLGILERGTSFADGILCFIIGLMAGRLGGIGLRVRGLKRENITG